MVPISYLLVLSIQGWTEGFQTAKDSWAQYHCCPLLPQGVKGQIQMTSKLMFQGYFISLDLNFFSSPLSLYFESVFFFFFFPSCCPVYYQKTSYWSLIVHILILFGLLRAVSLPRSQCLLQQLIVKKLNKKSLCACERGRVSRIVSHNSKSAHLIDVVIFILDNIRTGTAVQTS